MEAAAVLRFGRISMVKSSGGSAWLAWGVAVVVTTLIGALSFSVFVLSKVFGSSSPDSDASPPVASPTSLLPSKAPTPIVKSQPAEVVAIQTAAKNPRVVVLVVAMPAGCARKLRASAFAEGPGAVAVRVTQEILRVGCALQRKAVSVAAKAPVAGRTVIVNGTSWTVGPAGRYRPAKTDSSTAGRTT
jgi:hypothetical protein